MPRQTKTKRARTVFKSPQLLELEAVYSSSKYLDRKERLNLALKLNLTERQVQKWFQNRRMKSKKENSNYPDLKKKVKNGKTKHSQNILEPVQINTGEQLQHLQPLSYEPQQLLPTYHQQVEVPFYAATQQIIIPKQTPHVMSSEVLVPSSFDNEMYCCSFASNDDKIEETAVNNCSVESNMLEIKQQVQQPQQLHQQFVPQTQDDELENLLNNLLD
ncbi:homeobox protein abdominal-A homolog [Copidosoma floridanum]|uniref:homeobox protein abdominal-A homolog n=1 Tax=Copidosoma floridanum TaxID=29053 RepID=UPI000C6FB6BA|nr:homeobox protein abdominal-A homolog [Copidosoma floridanum]